MKLRNAKDIAAWRLCIGCGACTYICPENKIKLVDVINDGIRPDFDSEDCADCEECMKVCLGYGTIHNHLNGTSGLIPELKEEWGPVLEIWEGYAIDNDIRYNGSSGGLASALALYCLEKEGMHGVLHTGSNEKKPWMNKTVFSRKRAEILDRTGSRYSPASPCDGLGKIESAPSQCVFIGKPCDVTGLRKAQSLRPELDKKTGVAIGIFCAGTPSTQGTLDLLKNLNINPEEVEEIRYRGKGWPGMFAVRLKGNKEPILKMPYMDSWGFVQKYRPYRCYLCPDGTSEFADISCGDPWYREIKEGEKGYSLVLVRTERGREILQGAMKEEYVHLKKVAPEILVRSQKNLLSKRGAIWGRVLVMKMFFIPSPKYKGFSLFKNWMKLPIGEKVRSILGTARRIIQRKYYNPLK